MSRIGTIGGNVDSPTSTIGLSSAAPAPTRRSPRRTVAMQSIERSDGPVFPYAPSLTGGGQSPAVLGGASMPPPSPCRPANFAVGAVGIPTSKPSRKIKNVDENKWEEGYDSDGELGPFLDAVVDQGGVDVEGEDDGLPDSMVVVGSGSGNTTNTNGEVTSPDWFLSDEQINVLKVDALKEAIKMRGVVPKGRKDELRVMLKQCMEKGMGIVEGVTKDMQVLSGFPVGSRWKELQPGDDIVPEPVNEFAFHAPTDNPEALPRVQKQNFDETWDRPVFKGRNLENEVRLKGHPRRRWIKDEGLNENSHPVEWLDAMLPVYQKSASSKSETIHTISAEKLCRWSNEKARLMEMGTKTKYPTFTEFITEEWEQYLYVFFYNGLCPSPSVEMKLQGEETDPVQSDAFLRKCLGPNATVRFKQWKACFACQDPKVAIPSRKTHPNFKVDEYFRHLQIIFRYAWMPGRDLSGDEQTMGFKGKHADKLRITYKKEGDGFQCDCIADDGYTFTFYFRNQPAEKKWLDQGLSPLHSRCMSLFDCFIDEHHQVRFDNLYMSAKFALAAFQHPNKVMVEGVTRSSQRGLPPQVVQADVQKNRIAGVKGTVKAAVLEDCPPLASCQLVAASVYDQKGVHFLSTCVQRIHWIEKFREVFDKTTQRKRMGKFLRLAINDDYNLNMNNVDIADQLRGSYRPDRWMRKQKWWWSMFFWGHGTLLVNAFIAYKRFMENKGLKPMSHYDFQKKIVLAKICPTLHGAKKQRGTIASQRGDQRSAASSSRGRSKRSSETVASATRAATKPKIESVVTTWQRVKDDTSDFNRSRLDQSAPHFPKPVDNEKRGKCCALCRYAAGKKLRANLLCCSRCNVYLCAWCFKSFHTLPSISAAKDNICAEINERTEAKKEKTKANKRKGAFKGNK